MTNNYFENNEKPKKIIIEIGTSTERSYLKQYKIELPPDTDYRIINIDYDILPNEDFRDLNTSIRHRVKENSVDQVVFSNMLSDLPHILYRSNEKRKKLYEFETNLLEKLGNNGKNLAKLEGKEKFDLLLEEVAFFQKKTTLEESISILKPGGKIIIYENYRHMHKGVDRILNWLRENPDVEFTEDLEEEARIQSIFDADYKNRIEHLDNLEKDIIRRSGRAGLNTGKDDIFNPRPFNKVYRITKK